MAESASAQFAKMPPSSKILLLALILVLIGAGYYMLLHSPLTEQIEGAQVTQTRLREDLQKANDLQAKFLALREELETRKASEQQLLRILPPQGEMASMLADLNRLAELSGLQIRSVEPRPEAEDQFYIKMPVELKVSGRYHQLAKFFYNVSRLQRAINMENIQIGEPTVVGEDLILNVNVRATAFRRKDA